MRKTATAFLGSGLLFIALLYSFGPLNTPVTGHPGNPEGFLLNQGRPLLKTTSGKVWFTSDAPLENISAQTDELRGVLDTSSSEFAFSVNVISFMGFNSDLQREHFNENYLESERYPIATFSGKIIEKIDYNKNGLYPVRAKGYLTIHGVKRERLIPCKVTVKDRTFHVKSDFNVLLSDHGIKIPRIVYEKIAPEIRIKVEAELTSQQ